MFALKKSDWVTQWISIQKCLVVFAKYNDL